MPRKILAPHKEQDGWRYIRVPSFIQYDDTLPQFRIISSRRVEQDVETGDYLRLCADEGLTVNYFSSPGSAPCWIVTSDALESTFRGAAATLPHAPTLREAYHRYHAAADREDAS